MTMGRRLWIAVLLLQALWLTLQVRRSAGVMRAERILKEVEISTARALATQSAPAALLLDNAARLTEAGRLAPAKAALRLAKGSQYLLLGRNDQAIEAYSEALRLEPRPETYLNLGRAQWRAGREGEALFSFGIASRLDPNLRREIPRSAVARLP